MNAQPMVAGRAAAMWVHLSALIGLAIPFGTIAGPLILWLATRKAHPEADAAGKQSLNFQITMLAIYIANMVLLIVVILKSKDDPGFGNSLPVSIYSLISMVVMFGVPILAIVCIGIAAYRSYNGLPFRYPLSIRFLR